MCYFGSMSNKGSIGSNGSVWVKVKVGSEVHRELRHLAFMRHITLGELVVRALERESRGLAGAVGDAKPTATPEPAVESTPFEATPVAEDPPLTGSVCRICHEPMPVGGTYFTCSTCRNT